jgi:decaprenyl-phosphate phosphoribosyltransferase
MTLIINYIRLLRINHWIKNFFIFIPVFFSAHIFDVSYIIRSIIGFVCFSLIASSIYILNDWKDIEKDKLHPTKKNRPLAAGQINAKSAPYLSFLLFALAIMVHVTLIQEWISLAILLFYFVQNLLYTFRLKQIAIVDITIISLGFVLRLVYGGTINGIILSEWIILMTFLLSLFLAFSKRRNDVLLFDVMGTKIRKSTSGYNLQFIDISLSITASVVIIAYLMYTTSDSIIEKFGKEVYMTSFFVIIAILRYLKITVVNQKKYGDPTRVLYKDLFLQLLIFAWIFSFALLIYKVFPILTSE